MHALVTIAVFTKYFFFSFADCIWAACEGVFGGLHHDMVQPVHRLGRIHERWHGQQLLQVRSEQGLPLPSALCTVRDPVNIYLGHEKKIVLEVLLETLS